MLICEKTPSLSQKMMIYHKKYMSGVYENVIEKSEIFVLLSLRDRLLLTICVRIPCILCFSRYECEGSCLFATTEISMVRYGGRKVHTSGRIVKEIATWDGGDKSNWGPMFVQYLRVNSYGPLECHLIQISNRGRQIIFHPGLTFLASVFRTFLSYFSVPAGLAGPGNLEEFKVLT